MKYITGVLFVLAGAVSCSDGVQVAGQMNGIIEQRAKDKDKNNDITSVVLVKGTQRSAIPVDSLLLDGQFVVMTDTLVNLMWVEEIRVSGTAIELQFK